MFEKQSYGTRIIAELRAEKIRTAAERSIKREESGFLAEHDRKNWLLYEKALDAGIATVGEIRELLFLPPPPALSSIVATRVIRCPVPEHPDHNPSCGVWKDSRGAIRIQCYAGCDADAVFNSLFEHGLKK